MKQLYINPQTISVTCLSTNSIMLISGGGPSAEPGKAPMRQDGGKQMPITTLYI